MRLRWDNMTIDKKASAKELISKIKLPKTFDDKESLDTFLKSYETEPGAYEFEIKRESGKIKLIRFEKKG